MPGCPRRTRKYSRSHTWCEIKIWQKLPVYTETYPSKATRMYKEEERKGLLVWKKRIPQVLRVSFKATRMYVEGMTSLPLTWCEKMVEEFFPITCSALTFQGGSYALGGWGGGVNCMEGPRCVVSAISLGVFQ
jgi:hypothetical protein